MRHDCNRVLALFFGIGLVRHNCNRVLALFLVKGDNYDCNHALALTVITL